MQQKNNIHYQVDLAPHARPAGFTIIEVLIVLAIAGLIMLIVFLAVPALQRNSRNTQRGNDAGRALAAANDVINSNNRDISKLTNATLVAAIGKPAYYATTNITVAAAPAVATNATTIDTMVVYTGATCDTTGKAVPGTTRQLAAVWTAETATQRCQDS